MFVVLKSVLFSSTKHKYSTEIFTSTKPPALLYKIWKFWQWRSQEDIFYWKKLAIFYWKKLLCSSWDLKNKNVQTCSLHVETSCYYCCCFNLIFQELKRKLKKLEHFLKLKSWLVELLKNSIVFYGQAGFSVIENTCIKLCDSVTYPEWF